MRLSLPIFAVCASAVVAGFVSIVVDDPLLRGLSAVSLVFLGAMFAAREQP